MTYLTNLIIFLLGLYFVRRLTQVPVVINVTVMAKSAVATEEPSNEPVVMPEDVRDYIDKESDLWARQSRKHHARNLYAKLGKWPEVLIELRREDMVNNG